MDIKRDGRTERLVLVKLMRWAPCTSSRATACWKAHGEGNPTTPLVVKYSWQYTERDEEDELMQEATERGVIKVGR